MLNAGYLDIVMSGFAVTPEELDQLAYSVAYMDATLAFIVEDHRRNEFKSWEAIRRLDAPRIGLPAAAAYYIPMLRNYLPGATLVPLNSPREFFERKEKDLAAFVFGAEPGSAWTLVYPDYSVAVPLPDPVSVPLAYPVARGNQELLDFVNTWIELKKKDRTLGRLYDNWILGKGATSAEPRWSVIRNILRWVD